MTPAQELRAAAAELRKRAEGTTPVPVEPYGWSGVGNDETGEAMLWGGPAEDGYRTGSVFWFRRHCRECEPPSQADVAWMETVDPGLAEPLAAWLEWEADRVDSYTRKENVQAAIVNKHALAVARALLGGEQP